MKTNNLGKLFFGKDTQGLYEKILAYCEEEHLIAPLSRGALLGLSGGADSVLALGFLFAYAEKNSTPRPVCVHVHHGIRAESADRDADFCRALCESVGVELIVRSFDVPSLSRERRLGIEETAREVRYSAFHEIISGREDVFCIVTAHNATDNLETVLHRMLRGTGTLGLCGIPPIHENIVRPLLSIPKADIVATLVAADVPFVTDETNLQNDYTRNYLRNEVLPKLQRLTRSPEVSLTRLTRNLRMDEDYFSEIVDAFMTTVKDGVCSRALLSAQHPAVLSRVLRKMSLEACGVCPEKVHLDHIASRLLVDGDFEITLPGGVCFVAFGNCCTVRKHRTVREENALPTLSVERGKLTDLSPYGIFAYWGRGQEVKSFLNVYKIATEADLSSAIIEGELAVRPRRDGDKYRTRGMTRRLKTMLYDRGVPKEERDRIPVFTDGRGIVFVPNLGVREDAAPSSEGDRLFLLVPLAED